MRYGAMLSMPSATPSSALLPLTAFVPSHWARSPPIVSAVPIDCTTAAVTFFSHLRVPATLVAATALKETFALLSVPNDISHSKVWRLLRRLYLILMLFSFTEELCCVFISTSAMVLLQSSRELNTVALSLVEMLVRELEYEYVSVRHHFITGVLSLMIAQALRARQALRCQPALAKAAMFGIISSAASLLTYSNARTITYGGYLGMACRFCVLHMQMLYSFSFAHAFAHPMALVGGLSTLAFLWYLVQAAREPIHVPPEERQLGWGLGLSEGDAYDSDVEEGSEAEISHTAAR